MGPAFDSRLAQVKISLFWHFFSSVFFSDLFCFSLGWSVLLCALCGGHAWWGGVVRRNEGGGRLRVSGHRHVRFGKRGSYVHERGDGRETLVGYAPFNQKTRRKFVLLGGLGQTFCFESLSLSGLVVLSIPNHSSRRSKTAKGKRQELQVNMYQLRNTMT